jgi:hypothetical protein
MSKLTELLDKFAADVLYNFALGVGAAENMSFWKKTHLKDKLRAEVEDKIIALLPVERADTKVAPYIDNFHYGYNECVREMREMLEIE